MALRTEAGRRRGREPGFSWAAEQDRLRQLGVALVAGVDEAGCGAWAGPVVAAAAPASPQPDLPPVRDSKQLSPAQRESLYGQALDCDVALTVGLVYVPEIGRLNIFHAARLAMRRALDRLPTPPGWVLMDGHLPPDFGLPCRALVGGDALCPLISLASIVAKVHRDRIMLRLAELYPDYGFEEHKGYGTARHREALRRWGPCPTHRRSFAPISGAGQLSLLDA